VEVVLPAVETRPASSNSGIANSITD